MTIKRLTDIEIKSMVHRAYGLIEVKAFDDAKRTFSGIATTVAADRMGDVVEPDGAKFKLPIPFLYQHDSRKPVGWVTEATIGKTGIEVGGYIENIPDAPPSLKERLDVAWVELKSRLIRGLSIGFSAIEYAYIKDSYNIHYQLWEWLELSMVTIPANEEATILSVKSFDQRRADAPRIVRLSDVRPAGPSKVPLKDRKPGLIYLG